MRMRASLARIRSFRAISSRCTICYCRYDGAVVVVYTWHATVRVLWGMCATGGGLFHHLIHPYDQENICRIIEPYSVVETSHIATLMNLPLPKIEEKLSQVKLLTTVTSQVTSCSKFLLD